MAPHWSIVYRAVLETTTWSATMVSKNTICLWYDGTALDAAHFYAETDRLWDAVIGNGGQASACGWCKDRWGVSWQITPRALMAAIEAARRG
jgi:predicted 3-demethylubiquinone-9 3-methyltransferase (glyoxalase superfamily)